ncbi:hypothetical protein B0A50_06082 [Salinomyces thailandicus]|uniref:PhoD-like phosphatase domain-containing protein n=1 Tax=Salinomyces thailandicus TaxID=706561 RepID=A0A4U0TS71_9PEZI|nr:hypothetical protein B0A50_06082 [Salinomyces thailandica]
MTDWKEYRREEDEEEDLEQRRDKGHSGFQGDGHHGSATGAAVAAMQHNRGGSAPMAQFHNAPTSETQQPIPYRENGIGNGPQVLSTSGRVEVLCGPLLNYRRMGSGDVPGQPMWHGSVLIVTTPGQIPDELRLSYAGAVGNATPGDVIGHRAAFEGVRLYEDPQKAFWRFEIQVPFQDHESAWTYTIPHMVSAKGDKVHLEKPKRFAIPSKDESMRIMFQSCNGFSVGTDEDAWSGCALWNDVLRVHEQQPFHVMIGGGDQIYNDSVRVNGPLRPWTDIANPRKRRDYPFNEEMRAKCDEYYFNNYTRWYNTEPFASANGQIPQINIWDDHDIIDGFGSYTDHFMKCPVFRGIGGVAHKYYLLFQHHLPPPSSTYTSDAPQTESHGGKDAVQLKDTYVMTQSVEDPSYIIGKSPGPYVEEKSRSIYCRLGKRIAFAGIDARTERTRHQINYPETYDLFFNTISDRIEASHGEIKHLVLLLGVPIAYPRLQWLENILQSPLIGPLRFLNKRFGVAGGFFNQFDGNVDLLDDLDDHYTAHQHKKERKMLILSLQELAKKHSVRISIVSGDVHLAAVGRFYSNPKLNIQAEQDWRYIPNVVSSAITNKPPPTAVANLLAKRNKIHHLDPETDETLLEIFNQNPGVGEPGIKPKSAENNHATMPSRNYAIICESHQHNTANGSISNGHTNGDVVAGYGDNAAFTPPKNPREPLHFGEKNAGTKHPAAQGINRTGLGGRHGLDVTLRVEKNPSDNQGHTQGYGFSIPALESGSYKEQGERW